MSPKGSASPVLMTVPAMLVLIARPAALGGVQAGVHPPGGVGLLWPTTGGPPPPFVGPGSPKSREGGANPRGRRLLPALGSLTPLGLVRAGLGLDPLAGDEARGPLARAGAQSTSRRRVLGGGLPRQGGQH